MMLPTESVSDDELLTILNERKAGQGRFDHLTTVTQAVIADRGSVIRLSDGVSAVHLDLLAVKTSVSELRSEMREGFAAVDQRFEAMDRRFDAMDRRFEAMDQRFEAMDQRFDAMDQRFGAVDQRFDTMERRIVAQMEKFTDRVLKGVAAQLEAHRMPGGEVERRGYRS